MIINIIFFVFGILFGLYLGGFLVDYRWRCNSDAPQRILYGNNFYKVIKIDNEESWKLAEIHKNR